MLSKEIRRRKDSDFYVIDAAELARFIDLSEMPRDELEIRCARAMASCSLYQNGFRCVVRGTGLYLDYMNYRNPNFLKKLIANEIEDVEKRNTVVKKLAAIMRHDEENNEFGGWKMEPDEHGNIRIVEELSDDQIIEMLENLARETA